MLSLWERRFPTADNVFCPEADPLGPQEFHSPFMRPNAFSPAGFPSADRCGFILLSASPTLSLRLPDMRTENHAPKISLTVQRWALRPCPFTAPAFLPTPSLPLSRRPARTVRNPFAVQSGQTRFPPLVSRPQLGAAPFCFRLRHRCHCAFPTCGPQTMRPVRV